MKPPDYRIEVLRSEPIPTAVIRDRVPARELARFVPAACGEVWSFGPLGGCSVVPVATFGSCTTTGRTAGMRIPGRSAVTCFTCWMFQTSSPVVGRSFHNRCGAFDLLATRGARQLGIQVKRSDLPLRFKQTEWARMEAEGERLQWRWIVAAVSGADEVFMLDPGKASSRKEITLTEKARIPNLLLWLDKR